MQRVTSCALTRLAEEPVVEVAIEGSGWLRYAMTASEVASLAEEPVGAAR